MKKITRFIILLALVVFEYYWLALHNTSQINIPNKIKNNIKNDIASKQKTESQENQTSSNNQSSSSNNVTNPTKLSVEWSDLIGYYNNALKYTIRFL